MIIKFEDWIIDSKEIQAISPVESTWARKVIYFFNVYLRNGKIIEFSDYSIEKLKSIREDLISKFLKEKKEAEK